MKKFIWIFSFLSFLTQGFASQMLLTHACKGKDSEGNSVSVNLHMDEELFCAEDLTKPFVGALVLEDGVSPQQLIQGEIIIDSNREMKFTSKAMVEGVLIEVISLEGIQSQVYKLKILNEILPISYEIINLSCSRYQYNIDC